jgi:uncharacterized protein (TIGR00159 family)
VLPHLPTLLADLIDVALVAGLAYALILAARGTRAHLTLAGIGILGGIYLIARQVGLTLTAAIFQGFFAVSVLVLVVVFQRELRQLFERIAVMGFRQAPEGVSGSALEALVPAVAELAATKRGALIVLPGRDPLDRHLEGGIALDGELSFPLLVALFDPHSPGHDGAALVEGGRLRRFAVHLPLSTSFEQLRMRGTRHAAALGLAERSDALCIVVSEERGTISLARAGRLRQLAGPAELAAELQSFAAELALPLVPRSGWLRRAAEHWRELAAALGASAALWLLVVPGAEVAETTLSVPVNVVGLPNGFAVEAVDPPAIEVRVSGTRRDLFLLDPGRVRVSLDAYLVELGRRTFEIAPEDVRPPPGITVTAVNPDRVKLSVAPAHRGS